MVRGDLVRRDTEPGREPALEADGHVAQPDARCPASSRARVTMPTGLVKSTIQAPARRACGPARRCRARSERCAALWPNRRAGGLLAEAAESSAASVSSTVPGGLATDPQLDQDGRAPSRPRPGGGRRGLPRWRSAARIRAATPPTGRAGPRPGPPAPIHRPEARQPVEQNPRSAPGCTCYPPPTTTSFIRVTSSSGSCRSGADRLPVATWQAAVCPAPAAPGSGVTSRIRRRRAGSAAGSGSPASG